MNHIKKASYFTRLLAFCGLYKRVQIKGHSMWPLFSDGEVVIIKKNEYKIGDVIIFDHPFKKMLLVKQIEAIENGMYKVTSIQKIEGEDSSSFGAIKEKEIIGKVIYKM